MTDIRFHVHVFHLLNVETSTVDNESCIVDNKPINENIMIRTEIFKSLLNQTSILINLLIDQFMIDLIEMALIERG